VAQKSKLLTQYNSLLLFEPPCISSDLWKSHESSLRRVGWLKPPSSPPRGFAPGGQYQSKPVIISYATCY